MLLICEKVKDVTRKERYSSGNEKKLRICDTKEIIMHNETVTSLDAAVETVLSILEANPERDLRKAREAALAGCGREFPVMGINNLGDPEDDFEPLDEWEAPKVEMPDNSKAELARELIGTLEPLKMLNPITPAFSLGMGTGTLVNCFGIPLDPDCGYAPAHSISIDEVLANPLPDPRSTGLMPRIHEKINAIKDLTPASVPIAMPDTQGPFNIAHAVIGEAALIEPYLDPDKFRMFMEKITDFWINVVSVLREWIGKERLVNEEVLIAECSVNLISREMYEEFILPCDLRVLDAFGPIGIHTCSGQHVFFATLENIPDMLFTEAGYISNTVAGHTPVEVGFKAVENKPIMLNIGQELYDEDHFDTIKKHLDLYEHHKKLLFSYTCMNLRKRDRAYIRDLHNRLDEYWKNKYTAPRKYS
jgi:uroporphyrinogen-III decarboxylase